MKIRSDTVFGILRPALSHVLRDWAFYVAILLALLCAYVQSLAVFDDRAKIVRDVITLGAGIDVGALAVIFAASTIFASLMTKQFLRMIKDVEYLISVYAFSIVLLVCSVIVAFVLYLLSYAPGYVATKPFFWLCVGAEWLFFWAILQIVDSFRIVSLQMVLVSRFPDGDETCPKRDTQDPGDVKHPSSSSP